MTMSARLLKASDDNRSVRRMALADLTEKRHSRFAASDFEPLSLPAIDRQPAESRTDARVQSALAALNAAAEQLQAQRDRWLEQSQKETVRLGVAIAEQLLRRTLAAHPEAVIDLVRSALEWSVGSDHLSVRINPADTELVASVADTLRNDTRATLEFVADESLARGDCIVETPHGQIDARREVLAQRIADELLAE